MSDEFKKLDSFMAKHRPQLSGKIQNKKLQFKEEKSWWGVGAAVGISFLITLMMVNQHQTKIENVVEFTEVLEWDVTQDELPEELEVQLAMLD